jgi:hypothetical protein
MKLAGFLLLLSGSIVVLAAVALLLDGARVAFVLAGVAVEALGLGLAIHAHCSPRSERG